VKRIKLKILTSIMLKINSKPNNLKKNKMNFYAKVMKKNK